MNNKEYYKISKHLLEPAICDKLNEIYGDELKFVLATDAEDKYYKFDIKIIYNDGTFKGIDVKTIEYKNVKDYNTNFSLSLNSFYDSYDRINFIIFALPKDDKIKNYKCYICNKLDVKNACKIINNKFYLCHLSDIKRIATKEFDLIIK